MRGLSRRSWLIAAAVTTTALLLVLLLMWPGWAYQWDWTGLGASRSPVKNPKAPFDYYPSKSLWDWMQLLIIPAVLVVAGFLLNSAQQRRERDIAKENRAQDLEIAEDRQQEAALGEYLATMTTLLLDKKLRESAEGDEVRGVARAQTLTALRRVGRVRRHAIVEFLYEARLIGYLHLIDRAMTHHDVSGVEEEEQAKIEPAIVDLYDADLRGAELSGIDLAGACLRLASLDEAHLDGASLMFIALNGAILDGADLTGANLSRGTLSGATLVGARLSGAWLWGANLEAANLRDAHLDGALLNTATFRNANLEGAVLTGATGKTEMQLEQQAWSLKGATMPDGKIHP